jgi:hypothetical protein
MPMGWSVMLLEAGPIMQPVFGCTRLTSLQGSPNTMPFP